jgi:hypothetical protein
MKKIITYIIIGFVLAGGGYFIWRDATTLKGGASVEGAPVMSSGGEKAVATTTATTTVAGSDEKVKAAALNTPDFIKIVIDPGITGAAREKLIADIQEVITMLNGNVMNPAAWTQLGILRQNAKDYSGATLAWNFASKLSPQNSVPLLNIANLYGYYLHNNAKAEEYFKKAIVAEPKNGYSYFKTYEFFTDIGNVVKARAVLEQGVAAVPTDKQLKAVLDSLK